jgi:hypothetical protein
MSTHHLYPLNDAGHPLKAGHYTSPHWSFSKNPSSIYAGRGIELINAGEARTFRTSQISYDKKALMIDHTSSASPLQFIVFSLGGH